MKDNFMAKHSHGLKKFYLFILVSVLLFFSVWHINDSFWVLNGGYFEALSGNVYDWPSEVVLLSSLVFLISVIVIFLGVLSIAYKRFLIIYSLLFFSLYSVPYFLEFFAMRSDGFEFSEIGVVDSMAAPMIIFFSIFNIYVEWKFFKK